MTDCVFCKIIRNEAPSHKIWEDQLFCAFLTLGSLNPGHILLIPKEHVDYIFDLQEPLYSEIFKVAKQLSESLRKAMNAKRIGIIIEGFAVSHVHIHLVPLHNENEIDPRRVINMSSEELTKVAVKIRKEISNKNPTNS